MAAAPNRFYESFDLTMWQGGTGAPRADDYRTPFGVDRDRIIFSYAFRRLQSKTQVFQSGQFDFYRTRLTHSIEVARIGRSLCDYLRATSPLLAPDYYPDADLVEAVGLAHDLGHPPFGHIGERQLNDLMADYGGFEGNAQTLRILTDLIYERHGEPVGMTPTRAFVDGVLKYKALRSELPATPPPENHFLYNEQAPVRDWVLGGATGPLRGEPLNRWRSLECQIMDWADDTAYSLHDIVDGVKAGFLSPPIIEAWAARQSDLSATQSKLIGDLVESIRDGHLERRVAARIGKFIQAARLVEADTPLWAFSHRHRYKLEIAPEVQLECALYKRVALDCIFRSPQIQQLEFKGGHILTQLWQALGEHYLAPTTPRPLRLLPTATDGWVRAAPDAATRARRLCDYLAGLTDGLAVHVHRRLYDAAYGSILDLA